MAVQRSRQKAEIRIACSPVALYPDAGRKNAFLVMCEVMLPNGEPHPSNHRSTILDDEDAWFGLEQEYFLFEDGRPLGWPEEGFPSPQGEYYTGVGYRNVGAIAREIVDEHMELCHDAGINHEGINAEVAKGQWEFQIFAKGSRVADDMWIARYLLELLCEKYGIYVSGTVSRSQVMNGPACTVISPKFMREAGGKDYFMALMNAFEKNKDEHIAAYGPDNHMLDRSSRNPVDRQVLLGVADRGASIEFHTHLLQITSIKDIWKTVVRIPKAILIRSAPEFSRRSPKSLSQRMLNEAGEKRPIHFNNRAAPDEPGRFFCR